MDDLISRAAAQTELQLSARRYTVAHEAHGEGRVVWSEDLISVSDAMDVLRKIPPAQPTFDARDTQYNLPIGTDLISIAQAIDAARDWYEGLICGSFKGLEKRLRSLPPAQPERVWHPVEKPPTHHKDVIVRGVEAIGNVTVHKVMQWDVDTWRPTNYAPSIMWTEWSEI